MTANTNFISRVPTAGWARFLPAGLTGLVCEYFNYDVDFLPVTAAQSSQQDVQIQNDSHFVILGMFATVTETDNTTFLPWPFWPLTVQFNDTGAGRQLQNRAVPLGSVMAVPGCETALLQPKFIKAGSTFSTTLANLRTSGDLNVRIAFNGVKVFGF